MGDPSTFFSINDWCLLDSCLKMLLRAGLQLDGTFRHGRCSFSLSLSLSWAKIDCERQNIIRGNAYMSVCVYVCVCVCERLSVGGRVWGGDEITSRKVMSNIYRWYLAGFFSRPALSQQLRAPSMNLFRTFKWEKRDETQTILQKSAINMKL